MKSISAFVLSCALAVSANASQTSQMASETSGASGMVVVASGSVASMAVAGSVMLVVETVEVVGEGVQVSFTAVGKASEFIIKIPKASFNAAKFVVGETIELVVVTAEGTSKVIGYTLVRAGEVLLFIAE